MTPWDLTHARGDDSDLCQDMLLLPRHSRLESSCLHLKKLEPEH
jgi:hypothetical protein